VYTVAIFADNTITDLLFSMKYFLRQSGDTVYTVPTFSDNVDKQARVRLLQLILFA